MPTSTKLRISHSAKKYTTKTVHNERLRDGLANFWVQLTRDQLICFNISSNACLQW